MTQNVYSSFERTKLNHSYTFYFLARFSVFLHFAMYSKCLLSALSSSIFFFPSSPQSITFSVVILFCCIPFLFSFHCSVYYLDCLLTKSTSTFPFDLHQKHSCKTYIKFAVITLVKLFCSLTAWSTTVLDPSVQNNIVKRATGLLIP